MPPGLQPWILLLLLCWCGNTAGYLGEGNKCREEDHWWIHQHYNRTLYFVPYAGMGNRMRAIATALTAGREGGWNVKIVWDPTFWYGSTFEEVFSCPRLPTGVLPHKPGNESDIYCRHVHAVKGALDKRLEDKWPVETWPNGESGLCLKGYNWWHKDHMDATRWFYRMLLPNPQVAAMIKQTQDTILWHKYTWIGIHLRRTDLIDKFKARALRKSDCAPIAPLVTADSVLPLSGYVGMMQRVLQLQGMSEFDASRQKPLAFYIATDEPDSIRQLRHMLGDGTVIGHMQRAQEDAYQPPADCKLPLLQCKDPRFTVFAQQESATDLFMLASTKLLIGTASSSYSSMAAYLGGLLILAPPQRDLCAEFKAGLINETYVGAPPAEDIQYEHFGAKHLHRKAHMEGHGKEHAASGGQSKEVSDKQPADVLRQAIS